MNNVIDLTTTAGIKAAEVVLRQIMEWTGKADGKTVAFAALGLILLFHKSYLQRSDT
jgi:hypothetical protein